MDPKTYIVDAATLIDGIHELKQWVYDGTASLLVPPSTAEQVEKAAEASLAPKAASKEPAAKRASGRMSRREEKPLFDLNPQTAREFLRRAKDGLVARVAFQAAGEQFSQWKEEEERRAAAKVESPAAPPSSFAEALNRKLNLKDGSESEASKGSAKPRLVARSTEPKSPWTPHRVPKIPSGDVPAACKALLGGALWRLHDYANDPLAPATFVLLADQPATRAAAEKLGIPTATTASVRAALAAARASRAEDRAECGQLERDFPEQAATAAAAQPTAATAATTNGDGANGHTEADSDGDGDSLVINGDRILSAHDVLDDEELRELNAALAAAGPATNPEMADFLSSVDRAIAQPAPDDAPDAVCAAQLHELTPDLKPVESAIRAAPAGAEAPATVGPGAQRSTPPATRPTSQHAPSPHTASPRAAATGPRANAPTDPADDGSDLGSDEEVIVFNPRARRASALAAKRASGPPRSRPGTAHGPPPPGPAPAPAASPRRAPASPRGAPPQPPQPRPADEGVAAPVPTATLKPRSPPASALKPQSPVFTPGQLYQPASASTVGTAVALATPPMSAGLPLAPPAPANTNGPLPAGVRKPASPRPMHVRAGNAGPSSGSGPANVRPRPAAHRPTNSAGGSGGSAGLDGPPPAPDVRRQTEIIQRQRQAIQRQAQRSAAEARRATSSPPGADGAASGRPGTRGSPRHTGSPRHPASPTRPAPPPAEPRTVQLEPTANPTVIDPDAFDRSYVVRPPSSSAATAAAGAASNHATSNSAKRRSGGGGAGRRRTSPRNYDSPRHNGSPRSGSPRRVMVGKAELAERPVERDVEFVLKSGMPRGAARGKLWVP